MDNWYNEGGSLPIGHFYWVTPIKECFIQNHTHAAHEFLLPDLNKVFCPGLGMRYESNE